MNNCKLIIKDEVNIRIEGLPVEVRRDIVKAFKYFLPHAKYSPSYKLGRWDGSVQFFSIGGDGYLAHLPKIMDILSSHKYTISQIVDNRYPVNIKFPVVNADYWGDTCWPKGHPHANKLIRLRDDQADAIRLFCENPQSIQELTTGYGKTLVTATLAKLCEPYGRTITIVPSKDLVVQTSEDFINCGLDVGLYYGNKKEVDKTHTVCTWQAISVLGKKPKKNTSGDEILTLTQLLAGISAVIVDECFDGSTKILTVNGYRRIDTLKVGDEVINYCEKYNTFKPDRITKIHYNIRKSTESKFYLIEFKNGVQTKVSGNHKYLTSNGWLTVEDILPSHKLINFDNSNTRIIEKIVIDRPDVIYNLHVQNDHNYIANGAVVANCHGLKADELKALLLKYLNHVPIRWAMTGTIPKEEYYAESLYSSIGPLVNVVTAKELQDQGILSTCNINILQLIEYRQYKTYQEELKYLVKDMARLTYISGLIKNIMESGNTLVLVDRIETGNVLSSLIPDSVFISGKVKSVNRKDEYDAFKTENSKVLIATFGVASVGINIVSLYNLVLLEPGKSFVRVIQSIGRGLRKGFEKDHIEIWDITSSMKYSKRHLTGRKVFYKEKQYPFAITKLDWT